MTSRKGRNFKFDKKGNDERGTTDNFRYMRESTAEISVKNQSEEKEQKVTYREEDENIFRPTKENSVVCDEIEDDLDAENRFD